ncbi:MAG: peptide ABC transporter substrate-binding protein [Eubacteriales bacterium]|nr:peptide ABC transporter substrate-binding protein [Eubacteriales bacterium]
MNKTLWKRALCLALCLLLPLCQALAADSEQDETLILGIVSTTTARFNPLMAVEREFMSLHALVYEGLVSMDDDYLPQPALAQRWEPSADGASWQFTLREGVAFHDGTPLTAADVVATIQEILRLANDETSANKGVYASIRYFITDASAAGEDTVIIKTPRRNFGFLYAMNFPILPAAQVQADQPAGTGPYVVEQFLPKDYLWLSANSLWWGAPPRITEISVIFHTANRELISSYEYNRVDAVLTRSLTAAQYRSGISSLHLNYRTKQLETLQLNHRSYELEDVRVRQAIRFALNLDSIAETAYMGMSQRTDTPMPVGTWMYRAEDGAVRYNPEEARRLLDESGWVDSNDDGIRDMMRDGKLVKLSLRFYAYEEQDNSARLNAAGLIVSQLAAVGIEARLVPMSFKETAEKLEAGSYDLCLASFNMDFTPDPGFLLISGNTANYTRYKSAAMDTLFDELRSTMGRDQYRAKLGAIQDLFLRDIPFICLYYRSGAILTRRMFTSVRDVREPEVLRGIESAN